MSHASGSQALLSVLDGEENGAEQANGGVPMHTENGNQKSEEEFYGKFSGRSARGQHVLPNMKNESISRARIIVEASYIMTEKQLTCS